MNWKGRHRLKFKVVCRDETIGGEAFNHVMPIAHGDLNYLAFDDLSPPLRFSDTPRDDEGGAAIRNVFRDQAKPGDRKRLQVNNSKDRAV